MSRPRLIAFALLLPLLACRRSDMRLDDAQKLVAYAVKPGVVRISAYATADFHYPSPVIRELESQLRADGYDVRARSTSVADDVVETGAGGSGSGFVINPDGLVLTSGHVVAPTRDRAALQRELLRNGAIAALVRHFPIDVLRSLAREQSFDRYVARVVESGRLENVRIESKVELSNGETLPYRIRRWSPALNERGSDLAVLEIPRKGLPSLVLGNSDATRIGETIFSVGYPAVASSTDEVIGGWLSRDTDLEATFNPGTITAIRRNVANTPVLQSNVAMYRGNSGGPVVNLDGKVVGIATWGHSSADQIKFLVPIDVARQFLAQAGITPSADGAFNTHYRAALTAAANGDWTDTKRELALASIVFPKSPDLIRFSSDADRAVAAMPFWKRHALVLALIAVVIAVSTAATAVAVLRSRRFVETAVPAAHPLDVVVAPSGSTSPPGGVLGRFTILNGVRAGEKLGLGGSGIRIGRESAICEIVLENPKVSRLHAEVVAIDGKVLLIDRNSSNGTWVNEQKIDKRFLQDGDIIHFGGRNAVAVAFHA